MASAFCNPAPLWAEAVRTDETSSLRQRHLPPASGSSKRGFLERAPQKAYEVKLAQGEYLDTEEQEELLTDLRTQAAFIDRVWRLMLITLGAVLAGIFACFLIVQLFAGDNSIYFHRLLVPKLGRGTLILLQAGYVAAFLCGVAYALALPRPSEARALAAAITSGLTSFLFLLLLLMRSAMTLGALWIPCASLCYACAVWYASTTSTTLGKDLALLEKVKYKHASL